MNQQHLAKEPLPSDNAGLKPKKKSKLPYIIGGSAGGLALTIFVIIMVYKSGRTTTSTGKDSSVQSQSMKPYKGKSKNMGGGSLKRDMKSLKVKGNHSKDEDEPKTSSEEEDSGPNSGQGVDKSKKSKNRGEMTNQKMAGKGNINEDSQKNTDPIKTISIPPADPLKPFKSMKTSFVNNLKKSFLSDPDDEKLKTGYANLQNQLKHVLEKTPDFVDPDEVIKVSSTLTLDDFVKTSFTKQLEEIIQEYDKKLTEACKSNVAEYEALFNSWLAWIKRLKIDLTGRTTPEWITFKSYSEAKKWCAKSNPAIRSKDDIFLEELATIDIKLPTDLLEITPEVIFEIIEEIEKKASGADPEAIKKASEKVKDIQKKYSDLIASDKSKTDIFSRLLAISQAKSKASEIITKYKADLDPLLKDSKTSDDLIARIQAAKNFDEISNIIIGEYKLEDGYFKLADEQLHNKLTMMHLEVMAKYFEVRNEDPSVVDSLKLLANDVGNNKLSSYGCAEAWGKVILKMKDIGDIRCYADSIRKTKNSYYFSKISKFPNELFKKSNEDDLNKIRELHQEKTLMLLSAKSAADALEKICALDLELSTDKELHDYFETIAKFTSDDYSGHIYRICPYSSSGTGRDALNHLKDVVKRRVTKPPFELYSHSSYMVGSYLSVPKIISFWLQEEKEPPEELQKWAVFETEYEVIMGLGLEKNVANEEYFESYRKLKNDFSKDNLTSFFNLLLKNPEEFERKQIGKLLEAYCRIVTESLFNDVVNSLWKIKDGGRVAASIMALRNDVDSESLRFFSYNSFKYIFLLNLLNDDDVVREICQNENTFIVVELPGNFNFRLTPEFNEFVVSLKKLQLRFWNSEFYEEAFTKLRGQVTSEETMFAPSIGFLKPALKKYFPQESKDIIAAYRKLADVIGDTKIQSLMKAEVDKVEKAFNDYRILD